jgi:glycosyltransferase involved in cell wall biosynthesis
VAIVNVLVFTTVFPSPTRPLHGLFVAERTRHTAARATVRVIVPVAWFGSRTPASPLPSYGGPAVLHPRFFYVPGLFKCLDGVLLFLSSVRSVGRLRRQFDFGLIDAHFGYPDGVAAVLLGRWFRRPVVITLRGSEIDMARYKLRGAVLGWALRRAARVIAVSDGLATLASSLGVSADRIDVIGNGVDVERFHPVDRAAARRAVSVPTEVRLIVSVGHLARVKGFDCVVRAIPAIAAQDPAVRFVIVGGSVAATGGYNVELSEEIVRLGLEGRVTVTGSASREDVARWLNAADVFVLASEREGSPNAVREALACGCPVVASDVGDISQIVGVEDGILVEDRTSTEAWSRALLDALRAPWDRAAIRRRAERNTWTAVAARVAAVWQTAIAASGVSG